jgi:transcriptional regulator with XRE-family HTH domain
MEINLEHLGKQVKSTRTRNSLSQSDLAYRAGVSVSLIGRVESGKSVSEKNLSTILLCLGMKTAISLVKEEKSKVYKYKELSIDELKTCISACKDFIRDGEPDVKVEVSSYKKAAEKELLSRLREVFRGEHI